MRQSLYITDFGKCEIASGTEHGPYFSVRITSQWAYYWIPTFVGMEIDIMVGCTHPTFSRRTWHSLPMMYFSKCEIASSTKVTSQWINDWMPIYIGMD